MAYIIDNSDATLVVIDAEQAPLLAEVSHHLPKVRETVVFGGDVPPGFRAWDDVLGAESTDEPVVEADPSAAGAMIYTSGTTGKPKGALRTTTHPQTIFALLGEVRLGADEVHLTTGPSTTPVRSPGLRSTTRSALRSSCCAGSTRSRGSVSCTSTRSRTRSRPRRSSSAS